jgi:hypothetical protein
MPVYASFDFLRYIETQRERTGGDVAPTNIELEESAAAALLAAQTAQAAAEGAQTTADAAQVAADSAQTTATAAASDASSALSGVAALQAPQYVTLATSGALPNERVLTQGDNIVITDGGASLPVTVEVAQNPAFEDDTGATLIEVGTAALGFFGATPAAQPTTSITGAAFVAGAGTAVNDASTFDGYTLGEVVAALRALGLLA